MKALTIKTERFVQRGQAYYRIIGIDNCMPYEELPIAYTEETEGSHFFQWDHDVNCGEFTLRIVKEGGGYHTIKIKNGEVFPQREWEDEVLPAIRRAGNLLHKLREAERKLKSTWNGEVEFII